MNGELSAMPGPPNLRVAFEAAAPMTLGVEEELMVLDPETFDLAPRARAVLERLEGDARFKPELPAAQLEIAPAPTATVGDAMRALARARAVLAAAAEGIALLAGAGAHPFAAPEGVLSDGARYGALRGD